MMIMAFLFNQNIVLKIKYSIIDKMSTPYIIRSTRTYGLYSVYSRFNFFNMNSFVLEMRR